MNVKFKWSQALEYRNMSFKTEIASDRVLAYFNPKLRLFLAVDAPLITSQEGFLTRWQVTLIKLLVLCKELRRAEKMHNHVDTEALSNIFGVKNFFNFYVIDYTGYATTSFNFFVL